MKIKLLLTVFGFSLLTWAVQAQTAMKIGYANTEYILSKMPESKQVQSDLEATSNQLQKQLQNMYTEYEKKLQAYQEADPTMLDAVRQEKETELAQLQERIQKFQSEAQYTIQEKQTSLMGPLYEKIANTIEPLAKEEGFTHILNERLGGTAFLLYADKQFDVSDKVLAKMGL